MDFLEELLRECVLLGDSREGLREEITGVSWVPFTLTPLERPSIDKQTTPSVQPILLNMLYPDALAKLRATVGDVKQLYEQLKSVDPNGENGAIAKNTLLDTVDSSGINLQALELLLTHISEKIDVSNGGLASYSLARLECSMSYSNRRAAKYCCMQSSAKRLPSHVGDCTDSVQIGCHRKIATLYKT